MSKFIRCPACEHACGNTVDEQTRTTLSCQYCGYPNMVIVHCDNVGPDGWHCDRPRGHDGDHWAEYVEETLVRKTWTASQETPNG